MIPCNLSMIENSQDKTQSENAGIPDVKDRISDMASKVNDKAGHFADTVSEKVGQQRGNAAEGLDRVASTIHDRAESVSGGPKVVKMTHSIAEGMESPLHICEIMISQKWVRTPWTCAAVIQHSLWSPH